MTKLSHSQKTICLFVNQHDTFRYVDTDGSDYVNCIYVPEDKRLRLTMNIFCDIMTDRGEWIAKSNLKHDLVEFGRSIPTAWENCNTKYQW